MVEGALIGTTEFDIFSLDPATCANRGAAFMLRVRLTAKRIRRGLAIPLLWSHTTVSHPGEGQRPVLDAATDLAIDRTRRSYKRTLLSWVRTATALITFGFSVQQFFRLAARGLTSFSSSRPRE